MTQKTATAQTDAPVQDDSDLRAAKLRKLAAFEKAGGNAFPHKFHRTHKAGELQDKYAELAPGTETEDIVSIAGRIRATRNNGMFIDLHDPTGKIQAFSHKDGTPDSEIKKT